MQILPVGGTTVKVSFVFCFLIEISLRQPSKKKKRLNLLVLEMTSLYIYI